MPVALYPLNVVVVAIMLSTGNVFAGTSEDCAAAYDERKDFAEALRLCRPLAEQGDFTGQYYLGVLYDEGLGGLPKDYREAVKWYRKAADQGDPDAQYRLGLLYWNGRGVPQDGLGGASVHACPS